MLSWCWVCSCWCTSCAQPSQCHVSQLQGLCFWLHGVAHPTLPIHHQCLHSCSFQPIASHSHVAHHTTRGCYNKSCHSSFHMHVQAHVESNSIQSGIHSIIHVRVHSIPSYQLTHSFVSSGSVQFGLQATFIQLFCITVGLKLCVHNSGVAMVAAG